MMSIFVMAIVLVYGAIFNESIQYWISRGIAYFRPNSPLLGEWKIEYIRDNEMIEEVLVMYGAFAGVRYGDLHARLLNDETAMYRVRLELYFDDTYSAVIRPAGKRRSDAGLGILKFDNATGTVTGRTVGLSSFRNDTGRQPSVRDFKATPSARNVKAAPSAP